jgi:hypothetical protein
MFWTVSILIEVHKYLCSSAGVLVLLKYYLAVCKVTHVVIQKL